MRVQARRMGSVLGALVLAAASGLIVAGGGPAAAAACASPTTLLDDGTPTSLRGILESLPGACDSVELAAGATYDLTDDADGEIDVDGPVTIVGNGATIRQTDGDDNVMETNDNLTLRNVTITGGRAAFGDGGGVENNNSSATLRIEGSTITENVVGDGDGGGIDSEGPVVVVNSTISNNVAVDNDGGGISNDDLLTITGSTISGNCAEDDGGAIDGNGNTTIVNSTIADNISDDQGAIAMDNGDLTLVYSDVVGNTLDDEVTCPRPSVLAVGDPEDPEAAEVDEVDDDVEAQDVDEPSNIGMNNQTLSSFGSVIARPLIGAGDAFAPFNCLDVGETPPLANSSGYNFSDDATCGFTNTAAGDRESAGDPGLGALANNGGPTQTLLPAVTSPLLNFIPISSCSGGDALAGFAVTTDQRGILRPQATGCEVGSVEVEAVLVTALFTG